MPNHPQVSSLQGSPVISSKLSHVVAHLSGEKEGAQLLLCGRKDHTRNEAITHDQAEKKGGLTQQSFNDWRAQKSTATPMRVGCWDGKIIQPFEA